MYYLLTLYYFERPKSDNLMKYFIAVMLIVFSQQLFSKPVKFASYYIPGMVIDQRTGVFIKLHQEIMRRSKIDVQFQIMPTKRVQYAFKQNQLISYFPELYENLPKKQLILSESFYFKKIILFTLQNFNIQSTFDLEGLKLGAVHGYSYGHEIVKNKNIKLLYTDNDDINVKLLLKGRIDGILGDSQSTLAAINKSGFKDRFIYDLNKPINLLDVFYVCQNSPLGKDICNRISLVIKKLKSENIIKLDSKTGQSNINL